MAVEDLGAEINRIGNRYRELDAAVTGWSKNTRQQLLMRLAQLGLKDRVALRRRLKVIASSPGGKEIRSYLGGKQDEPPIYSNLRVTPKRKNEDLERISILFPRHGIFIEHGVGKYRPVRSPAANRAKRPWLSLVLPNAIEDLADLLAEEYADIAVAELRINIPGVFKMDIDV